MTVKACQEADLKVRASDIDVSAGKICIQLPAKLNFLFDEEVEQFLNRVGMKTLPFKLEEELGIDPSEWLTPYNTGPLIEIDLEDCPKLAGLTSSDTEYEVTSIVATYIDYLVTESLWRWVSIIGGREDPYKAP
jgi:hypothetical protein